MDTTRGSDWARPTHHLDLLLNFFRDCAESLRASGIGGRNVRLVISQTPYARTETVESPEYSYIIYDQGFSEVLHILNKVYLHARESDGPQRPDYEEMPPQWVWVLYSNRFLSLGSNADALACALKAKDAAPIPTFPDFTDDEVDKLSRWGFVQQAFIIAHELAHCRLDNESGILARGLWSSFNDLVRDAAARIDAENTARAEFKATFDADMMDMIDNAAADIAAKSNAPKERLEQVTRYLKDAYYEGLRATMQDESVTSLLDSVLEEGSDLGEEVLSDYFALHSVTQILGDQVLPFDECILVCILASYYILTWRAITLLAASSLERHAATDLGEIFRGVKIRALFLELTAQGLSHFDHLGKLYQTDLQGVDFVKPQDERKAALLKNLRAAEETYTTWVHHRAVIASDVVTQYRDAVLAHEKLSEIANLPNLADIIAATVRIGYTKFSWEMG